MFLDSRREDQKVLPYQMKGSNLRNPTKQNKKETIKK
jgi:hypothetical protein